MLPVKMLNRTFLISICFSATFVAGYSVSSSESRVVTKATASLDSATQSIGNGSTPETQPMDCEDVLRSGLTESGVYKVLPRSRLISNPIEVYCDMDTDGGGWTVFQRRGNFLRPIDYFYKDWKSYKEGFGNLEEDFWLGNDKIFGLSNQRKYSVRFDLRDVDGNERYALYDTFWIDGEENKYMLHIAGYSGDAGDSMTQLHNGMKFSTKDQKNDRQPNVSCAQLYKGAWWYNWCHHSNLNGMYYRGKHTSYADGVNWDSWKGLHESLEWTEIKIRRQFFRRRQLNFSDGDDE